MSIVELENAKGRKGEKSPVNPTVFSILFVTIDTYKNSLFSSKEEMYLENSEVLVMFFCGND